MAVKVFISWSGELSRKVATEIHTWLPSVLQVVRPYFSPADIDKGVRWESDISTNLGESDVGLICLTKDNVSRPWILFEAGALSKHFEKSRVYTVLFGIEPSDIKPPLSMFQHTKFARDDVKKLVQSLNNIAAELRLEDTVVDNAFDMSWAHIETKVKEVLESHVDDGQGEHRPDRELLSEILQLARSNNMSQVYSAVKVLENRLFDLNQLILNEGMNVSAFSGIVRTGTAFTRDRSGIRREDRELFGHVPDEVIDRSELLTWMRSNKIQVKLLAEAIRRCQSANELLLELKKMFRLGLIRDEIDRRIQNKDIGVLAEINAFRFGMDLDQVGWEESSEVNDNL